MNLALVFIEDVSKSVGGGAGEALHFWRKGPHEAQASLEFYVYLRMALNF